MPFEKGLGNQPGQNNCFLNVVIQVLWHLEDFRIPFSQLYLSQHHCPGGNPRSCIFCALKHIFTQIEYSPVQQIPIDALRVALSVRYGKEGRFALGELDDAMEAFEAVLESIHNALREPCVSAHYCTCVAHDVFSLRLADQVVCRACGAASKPLCYQQWILNVCAADLWSAWTRYPHLSFGALLRQCMAEHKSCPAERCACKSPQIRMLLRLPKILPVALNWHAESVAATDVAAVAGLIPNMLEIDHVFPDGLGAPTEDRPQNAFGYLRAVICYRGRHYFAFLYSALARRWLMFNDSVVSEAGTLDDVLLRCQAIRAQPSLLLYTISLTHPSPARVEQLRTQMGRQHARFGRYLRPAPLSCPPQPLASVPSQPLDRPAPPAVMPTAPPAAPAPLPLLRHFLSAVPPSGYHAPTPQESESPDWVLV
eukprot:gnl/Trimastix_PCT/1194.p1 GENE.gnl/Trimastix_PCT/1194~~gnl/Trimastix_PCT/1194.p1  ORF type:complete len:425 (-),score=92.35 gnl/Trimastix_PCT/1194:44-1318(-)